MKISTAQSSLILSLLHSKLSEAQIVKKTGVSLSTISRIKAKHCPDLPKHKGGHPSKLSPADIAYSTKLFCSGKAENAAQANKLMANVVSTPFSSQTLRRSLKKVILQI